LGNIYNNGTLLSDINYLRFNDTKISGFYAPHRNKIYSSIQFQFKFICKIDKLNTDWCAKVNNYINVVFISKVIANDRSKQPYRADMIF
jgi:hypothetical protein